MFTIMTIFLEVIILLIIVSQVIVPLVEKRKIFPAFREKELHDELAELKQQVHEEAIKEEIKQVKSKLKGKK